MYNEATGGAAAMAASTRSVLSLIRTISKKLADIGSTTQGSNPGLSSAEADAKARVDEGRDNNGAAAECLLSSAESVGEAVVEESLSPEANFHLQEAPPVHFCEASGNKQAVRDEVTLAGTTHGGTEESVLKATKMGVEVTLPFESAPEVVDSSLPVGSQSGVVSGEAEVDPETLLWEMLPRWW